MPDLKDPFTKALYATYLAYLPEEKLCQGLAMHADSRGSFTELMRTPERGQASVNISRPGVTRGDHWHCTKHERLVAVAGRGAIRLRPVVFQAYREKIDGSDVLSRLGHAPPQMHPHLG